MKNLIKRYSLILVDFIAIFTIYFISSFLTKGFTASEITPMFFTIAFVYTIFKLLVNFILGNYAILWMYKIRRNLVKLLITSFLVNVSLVTVYFTLKITNMDQISFNTMLVGFLVEFCYLFISRFSITYLLELSQNKKQEISIDVKKTIIVGAGQAGNLILDEIGHRKEYGYDIVGFIDDDEMKIGRSINTVDIYGPINSIANIIETKQITKVIIAIPSAPKARIQEIIDLIDMKNVNVSIVPDKTKLLDGSLQKHIRQVSIDDLLGRESISLNKTKLESFVKDKTVLVTGGGGSIGSEICRQVAALSPKQLIFLDIYENNLYSLKTELDMVYKDSKVKPNYIALIGSVRDQKRLEKVFEEYNPNIVFHAAAHKHVPLVEDSPLEAIKNNVVGTYNVAKQCNDFKVDKMVLISTDKAVNPTNIMGLTKRFCEMVVEAWNVESNHTKYSMVRFGNVLGSNGSVIPLFEKQIAAGGPVTVTHEEINRFFMTIPEACGLVIESGIYAEGGEKFILDMGQPVKIIDLAKKMIKLSGLTLGKDINIEVTGLRPGEKLYEELLLDYSKASKTPNEKIFIEKSRHPFSLKQIDEIIMHLTTAKFKSNKEILDILDKVEEKKQEVVK